MRVGGKRVMALSIDLLCDGPEREQPTPTQFQSRQVKVIQYCAGIITENKA